MTCLFCNVEWLSTKYSNHGFMKRGSDASVLYSGVILCIAVIGTGISELVKPLLLQKKLASSCLTYIQDEAASPICSQYSPTAKKLNSSFWWKWYEPLSNRLGKEYLLYIYGSIHALSADVVSNGNDFETSTMRLGADVFMYSSSPVKDGKSSATTVLSNFNFKLGNVHQQTIFHVIDADVAYHILLRRKWLNHHYLIGSKMHQCIKGYWQDKEVFNPDTKAPFEKNAVRYTESSFFDELTDEGEGVLSRPVGLRLPHCEEYAKDDKASGEPSFKRTRRGGRRKRWRPGGS
ncbi:hypothetical protein COLO4_36616 [Corchorus olitorius]|uniref:Uncharacterized protein n=1 Tax=Corchorus olitorius TaxID=93759 RepID=A0A1R3G794_9ROSI|nr:hypothetical protein COLO4_36616 [Corchorus olitorius]